MAGSSSRIGHGRLLSRPELERMVAAEHENTWSAEVAAIGEPLSELVPALHVLLRKVLIN